MIRRIRVSGFRSLTDFELELNRGLNVLVGPNGSGKTNIVSFFEFLGDLQRTSLISAIVAAGGASSVFAQVDEQNFCDEITCRVNGITSNGESFEFEYDFSFKIKIATSKETVFYANQRLILVERPVESEVMDKPILDISSECDEQGTQWLVLNRVDLTKFDEGFFFDRLLKSKKLKVVENQRFGENDFKSMRRLVGPEESLIRLVDGVFEGLQSLRWDLSGGDSYNVIPSKIRNQEDALSKPGIRKDGSGLFVTLHALKKLKDGNQKFLLHRPLVEKYLFNGGPDTWDEIIATLRLANPLIKNLTINFKAIYNQIDARVWIDTSEKTVSLPLSALSDGTLKWLSLIAIIQTSTRVFSIEEPENYLHPLMQQEFVRMMRKGLEERENSTGILTTHSESILNSVDPDEVIVVSNKMGLTRAVRPQNASELRAEISKTGFGLGFYFVSGSFDE